MSGILLNLWWVYTFYLRIYVSLRIFLVFSSLLSCLTRCIETVNALALKSVVSHRLVRTYTSCTRFPPSRSSAPSSNHIVAGCPENLDTKRERRCRGTEPRLRSRESRARNRHPRTWPLA
ncbi:hypothetical protein B0H11DRAFT_2070871 [Mycena galericulata]|nr:hypothetical protein B0H11DRAFT_2070871 [Mycena galericulata]